MNIAVAGSLAELEKLQPEWLELYRRCPRATPFQSPQWLIPWTRHLFGGGEILALALREQGELLGFAPLFCWGMQRKTVSFLGAGISDYGDLLFAPGRENECAAAVKGFLARRLDCGNALDLRELPADSALRANGTEVVKAEPCSVCPVLDLRTFPDTMDHKHRTDVRRAGNKLRKLAELQFTFADETNFTTRLHEFFQLHEARSGPLEASLQTFHREAAAAFLAEGALRLGLLHVNQAAAAAIYAFRSGSTLYCYLSGFDPALAKLSPGAVLLDWTLHQALAEGLAEVDFLRQPEDYKYLWGAQDRVNYRLHSSPPVTV